VRYSALLTGGGTERKRIGESLTPGTGLRSMPSAGHTSHL
jgi:hypothetical protein